MRCSAWPAVWFRRPSRSSCWVCETGSCGFPRRRSGSNRWREGCWSLVSLFISSRLQHEPIYEALAVQDGIHLPSAKTRQRSGQRKVIRVMQTASQLLPAEITVREALERIRSSEFKTWLVTDRRGVVGVINLSRLERELAEAADKKLGELVDALVFPHVHPDQGLDLALERMGANQIEILPVVNRADVHKLEGVVTLREVLDAYGVTRA